MKTDPFHKVEPFIERVETALENMRGFLEKDREREKGKRKHLRYGNRYLNVEYQLFKPGTSSLGNTLYRASVIDVSAGGMRIDVDKSLAITQGQRMKFEIKKPSLEVILGGTAQISEVSQTFTVVPEPGTVGLLLLGIGGLTLLRRRA